MKPKCSHCGTIAVANAGDVCGPCKQANAAAEAKLLADLAKGKDEDE